MKIVKIIFNISINNGLKRSHLFPSNEPLFANIDYLCRDLVTRTMSIFAILLILLLGNWLFSDALIFFPFHVWSRLSSLGWLVTGFFLLLFLAWCLGDERA